jgi:transcriptional regulator with XRE-family HTH domain
MEKNIVVGTTLRAARQQKGVSQRQLATLAGLRQCQISDLEQGKLALDHVHWGTIRKLCDALALTPNDLMEYDRREQS